MNEPDPERQDGPATDPTETEKKNRSGEWALAIIVLVLGLVTLAGAF